MTWGTFYIWLSKCKIIVSNNSYCSLYTSGCWHTMGNTSYIKQWPTKNRYPLSQLQVTCFADMFFAHSSLFNPSCSLHQLRTSHVPTASGINVIWSTNLGFKSIFFHNTCINARPVLSKKALKMYFIHLLLIAVDNMLLTLWNAWMIWRDASGHQVIMRA